MSKLTKKLLVLLMTAVITLTALTLVACEGLFGPADQPERLEIINSGGEVPEDVTDATIKMYIMAQYYDKKGNGNMLNERDFSVVQFDIVDYDVNVAIKYNNLTAFGYYCIHREIIKDHTHVIFTPNDQYNTVIPSQDLNMGEYVREPNTPSYEGATFLGWFTKEVNQDGTNKWTKWDFSQPITLSGENTLFLYGRWERLVTVNYYDDVDGELHATEQVNILDNDAVVSSPDDPTKTNYAFVCWRTFEESDETFWDPHDVFYMGLDRNIIEVYPKYVATFNVVFDTNGGEPVNPLVVWANEPFSAPETATKDGYEFVCWSINDIHAFGINYRTVFYDEYSIGEKMEVEGQVYGLEAGATFTVYAEFYNENEPTEGLIFDDYVNADGVTESDKCIVKRNPNNTDDNPTIERTAFAIVVPQTHNGKTVVGIDDSVFTSNGNLVVAVLPNTITYIKNYVFAGCYNLRYFTLPSAVKSIGSRAFLNCRYMDFVLPEGLISIGESAFSGTAFNGSLPSTLKTIGAYAFGSTSYQDDGTLVTSVVLPAGLETLGAGAFARCSELTSVTITSANCEIGADAFAGCKKLTDVTLAQGMEAIPNGMFSGCSSLESIVLPSTVTSIGNSAFFNTGLTSLTLPSGLLSIGNGAFSYAKFNSITLPSALTSIGQNAFEYSAITQVAIPGNITAIPRNAFAYCSSLTTVTLPSGLESIGAYAFAYSKLTSITMPNSLQYIDNYAFTNCRSLTSVNLAHVQTIGERAFNNCSALTTLTMSDAVEEISSYAFMGTNINFGSLTLPNTLILFGREAFSGCTITSVTVNSEPELLISAYAFTGIVGLQSVSLLGNIKSIGIKAFDGCSELTSVSLTNTIQEIRQNTFANTALKTLAFNGDLNDWLNVTLNDTLLADNNVTITFNGNELTSSVTITPNAGETLTIGQYALQGLTKVTSFTLNNVKSVGSYAFYGCAELTNVTFNSFATDEISIQRNAFDNCAKLQLQYSEYDNGLYLASNSNAHYLFVKPANAEISQLNLHADTKVIAANALRYEEYTSLTSITLNEGLEVIGEGAFYGCNLVTELVLPDSTVYVGKGAFEGWNALKRLTTPFVGDRESLDGIVTDNKTKKLAWLFGGEINKVPSSLEYVEVTGGIICSYAFQGCSNLKELNAAKATRVLRNALAECSGLVKLTVPTSITYTQGSGNDRHLAGIVGYFSTGSEQGQAPASLIEVTIMGGGVLDSNTFYGCHRLTKVTLGVGVTRLPESVFNGNIVGELYYEGTIAQWNAIEKVTGWKQGLSVTVVHCSDGDVQIG